MILNIQETEWIRRELKAGADGQQGTGHVSFMTDQDESCEEKDWRIKRLLPRGYSSVVFDQSVATQRREKCVKQARITICIDNLYVGNLYKMSTLACVTYLLLTDK